MRALTDYDEVLEFQQEFGIAALRQRLDVTSLSDRRSFLISAAAEGSAGLTKILLPYSDEQGNTEALSFAISGGHRKVVKLLIPHAKCAANNGYALVEAAKKNAIEIFNDLLPHVPLNNLNAYSIFNHGMKHKNAELMGKALPLLVDATKNSNMLIAAVRSGNVGAVEMLLPCSNLIKVFKELDAGGSVYSSDSSNKGLAQNTDIFMCVERVKNFFSEKLNCNLFEEIPTLDLVRGLPPVPKFKV